MVSKETLNKLRKAQNECLSIINSKNDPQDSSVSNLVHLEHLKLGYRMFHQTLLPKITSILTTDQKNKSLKKMHHYSTRNKNKLNLPNIKNTNYRNSFLYQSNKEIALLPQETISLPTLSAFVSSVKKSLVDATD